MRYLLIAVLLIFAAYVRADTVNFYATGMVSISGPASTTGTENSATIVLTPVTKRNSLLLVAIQNYDLTATKVAMLFDATSLPANGTIPLTSCALPQAPSSANPGQCSFALPSDGLAIYRGITVACSTTGKTLTVDTTTGGNCYFNLAYR